MNPFFNKRSIILDVFRIIFCDYLKNILTPSIFIEIFLSIFYSGHVLFLIASKFPQKLTSFSDRIIGIATLTEVDISSRIKLYATLLVSFPIFFILFLYLIKKLKEKSIQYKVSDVYTLFLTSGIFSFFYTILYALSGNFTFPMLGYLTALQIFAVFYLLAQKFLKLHSIENKTYLPLIVLFGIAILLPIEKYVINSSYLFSTRLISLIIGLILSTIFIHLYRHIIQKFNKKHTYKIVTFTLYPIFLFITIPLLSTETYFVLNSRLIHGWGTKQIQLFYGLIFLIVYLLSFRYANQKASLKKWNFSSIQFIFNYYAPIFILVLMLSGSWTSVLNFESNESSETGNNIVAVQQFLSYNKLPIIETFPPHLFSDIIGQLIYIGLHGYSIESPFDMLVYFIGTGWIFPTMIFFYFLLKKVAPPYFALFLIVLMPIPEEIILSYYGVGYIGLLYFISSSFYKNKRETLLKWIAYWMIIFGLLLYRVDLGVTVALVSWCILIILFILVRWIFSIKLFFQSAIVSIMGILVLFVGLCFLRDINPIERLQMIRSILSLEGQSNTLSSMLILYSPGFFLTYFVIPISMFVLFIYEIRKLFSIRSTKIQTVILILLFFQVFYFVTFTRALLRHGWIEQQIQFLFSTSGIVCILISFTFFKLKKNMQIFISILSLLFVYITIQSIFNKVPSISTSILSKGHAGYAKLPSLQPTTSRISRVNFKANQANEFQNFQKLIDLTLSKEETFLIFHNKDFLYAATNRIMPTYMGQVPMGYSCESCQKHYLKEIQKFKAPLLIFEHSTRTGWDEMDGVPNSLRAYRIAEYMYTNYEPLGDFDNYFIWVQKTKKQEFLDKLSNAKQNNVQIEYKLRINKPIPQYFSIGKLAYIWANFDKTLSNSEMPTQAVIHSGGSRMLHINAHEKRKFQIQDPIQKETGNYIYLRAISNSDSDSELILSYSENDEFDKNFSIYLQKNKHPQRYLIRVSSQWKWMNRPIQQIQLESKSDIQILELSILKGD